MVYLVQFNVRGTVSLVRGATEALAAIDVILLTNFKSVADVTRPVGPLGADLRVAPCVRHRYSGVDASPWSGSPSSLSSRKFHPSASQ